MEINFPLRVVITNSCNGGCEYCHNEGNQTDLNMPLSLFEESIISSKILGIKKIVVTGGEPCLHPEFKQILNILYKHKNNDIRFGITTNGLTLFKYKESINKIFSFVSCSIFSLKKSLWKNFTNVDPYKIFYVLEDINIEKDLNIIINESNICELDNFIEVCEANKFDIKFMVQIPKNKNTDLLQYRLLRELYDKYKEISISDFDNRFYATINTSKIRIRLNLPIFSKIQNLQKCRECNHYENCGEYVCAIRLYPNGLLSNCLNNNYSLSEYKKLSDGIFEIYKIFSS